MRLCFVDRVAGVLTRAGMLIVALAILGSAGFGYIYITDRPRVEAGNVTTDQGDVSPARDLDQAAARDAERTPEPSSAAPSAPSPSASATTAAPGTRPKPTQAAADTKAPSAPKNLTLQQLDPYEGPQVVLDWDPSTDNVGVVGYRIYRDGVEVNTVADGSSDDTDRGFAMGRKYRYAVRAYDAAGNLSAPVEATISTVSYAG
jgi:hypothetical protein